MRHTILSWDCAYRDFFHLVDSLAEQDRDPDEWELIYIEQRSRAFADARNHALGVESLADHCKPYQDSFHVHVEYLDDPPDVPYHLGRALNHGLSLARGEIISVMDGDMLLPPDFLDRLGRFHAEATRIVNLHRVQCPVPVGVSGFRRWRRGRIDYRECLRLCPTRHEPVPATTRNKGPLISAPADLWQRIDGYDPHRLWSTAGSMGHRDVSRRLETLSRTASVVLPGVTAVHPWHPIGLAAAKMRAQDPAMLTFKRVQKSLIDQAARDGLTSWRPRAERTEALYQAHREAIETVFDQEGDLLATPAPAGQPDPELDRPTGPLIARQRVAEVRHAALSAARAVLPDKLREWGCRLWQARGALRYTRAGKILLGDRFRPGDVDRCEKLVSQHYFFIWVFTPKAAGTSIKNVLTDLEATRTHAPLWRLVRERSGQAGYFIFAFVRNPWDRVVSCYRNKIDTDDPEVLALCVQPYEGLRAHMPFEEFVDWLASPAGSDQAVHVNRHWASQYLFFTDPWGKMLVDFVGRFENLADDFRTVCDRLMLSCRPLPKLNATAAPAGARAYRTWYDDRTRRIVARRYARDIELFGYEF